jgi:hypothetical protein
MKTNKIKSPFMQCPKADDYTMFLSGKGSPEFNQAFNEHLQNCPLCSEAVEGYKAMNEVPSALSMTLPGTKNLPSNQKRWVFYIMGTAASVLILMAGWWTLNKDNQSLNDRLADNPVTENVDYTSPLNKAKLSNRVSENYWYVCNDNVYVNDQVIKPQFINQVIDDIDPSKSLIIEVGCSCNDNVNKLINQIKNRKTVTILTFSKDARIKPNRS